MKQNLKKNLLLLCCILCVFSCTGCSIAGIDSAINNLSGTIAGNTYHCSFFTNEGDNYMNMDGQKINMDSNIVKEPTYTGDNWGYTQTMSSVISITIDGKQVESCGSTIIFEENGLSPDVNFNDENLKNIQSEAVDFVDNMWVANIVNKYKNYFGKGTVVVIQSQLGDPICAYSGDDVYWTVCQDLPKTTKLMIDGKALYIHRANFVIVDKELLN